MHIMDLAAGFVPAWDTPDTKYDAVPLLRAAKHMAGKVPGIFMTDGLKRYHIAFKAFRTIKGVWSIHTRNV